MKHPQPLIAIIGSNALMTVGLREIIVRMIPVAVVRTFRTFSDFAEENPDVFAHFFIASQVLLEHSAFFLEQRHKTFVLTNGTAVGTPFQPFHTLNVCQPEDQLVKDILRLQQRAHEGGKHLPQMQQVPQTSPLSHREVEVLTFIVRGLINKEIAERLHIGLTTVISHRKNIMEKLRIHTVSGLTIYAVMHGYVEVERI